MTFALPPEERAALDALEPRLLSQGYQLVREPTAGVLPDFLRGALPDAVALGGPPNLLIEVLSRSGPPENSKAAAEKLEKLRASLYGHPDWRLEVVLAPTLGPLPAPATVEDIRRRVEQVRKLDAVEPSGALLLAWSLLEAAVRLLEPERAARAMTPGAMAELLLGQGLLGESDGETLRASRQLCNAVAHGDLSSKPPTPDQVGAALDLVDRLLSILDQHENAANGS